MAPAERREQLLDTGLRIIIEQGVHMVSIDAVARKAGVSRPVVYGHFDDSDQLLRALLDREESAALAQMAAVVPRPRSADPADALSASLAKFLDVVTNSPERWRAVFTLVDSSTPAFRRRLESGRTAYIAALASFVRSSTAREDREPVDVEMTARTVFALVWDAGRLVLDDPENFPPARIARVYDSVFRSLLERQHPSK